AGHYALSYSFFIPAVWLMLLNLKKNSAIYLFSIMAAFNVFMGFLHPYYILIAAVFQLTYILVHFLYLKKEFVQYKNKYLAIFSSAGISIVVFQLILKYSDHVTDRPQSPWGLMNYRAVFEGIYLPVTGILKHSMQPYFDNWFMKLFFDLNYQSIESNAYVGILGLIFLFFILIRIIYLIRSRKKNRIINPVLPFELKVSIFCSLLILLFAMAYPFRLSMEFLLEIIPPLKQFRSLGRFAWVFYHVFLVCMCYYIFLLYKVLIRKNKIYAYVFIACISSIWCFDVYEYVQGYKPDKIENFLGQKELNTYVDSFNPKEYQCILTLPLYIAGTEKIDKSASTHIKKLAAIYGYKYHLPNISGDLSRTSILFGQNLRQVSSNLFIHKNFLKDIHQDSILVIVSADEVSKNEKQIIQHAQLIKQLNNGVILYRISPAMFEKVRDSLIHAANISFNGSRLEQNFIADSFDSIKGINPENRFYGEGALILDKSNDRSYTIVLPQYLWNKTIEVSLWTKLNYNIANGAMFEYTLCDGRRIVSTDQAWLTDNEDIDHGWMLAKKQVTVTGNRPVLTIKSNIDGSIIDELIIKEVNACVYTHISNNKAALFNNYLLNR
ncbi:MAG TPA: hypothetical protein VK796_01370, partial [Cytophaga sp.]|nr:hypothetical protein [Cytophaga sp.]